MSSNGIQGNSSFWRPRGSNEDKQPAPISRGWGRLVSSNHPATGGGESERPPSSFKPPAAGGGGWGGQPSSFNRPAAVGGKWGPSYLKPQASGGGAARPSPPPNFTVVLITALLLLPGVTQPIANVFTQDYIQKNQVATPHTQDDIDRAIAAFNRQHPQKAPAPPEGYTPEHVSHCFHAKYDLPENLRDRFEVFVQSYITKNPQSLRALGIAVDRALLQIHESLSKENGGQIPEKANRDHREISDVQRFRQDLRAILVSYDLAPDAFIDQFLTDYFKKKSKELRFPWFDSDSKGVIECERELRASLYTKAHQIHAIYTFFIQVDIIQCVDRKLRLSTQGQIPLSFFPRKIGKLIMAATNGSCGLVPNAFIVVLPPDRLRERFHKALCESMIMSNKQSAPLYYPLTKRGLAEGGIAVAMCDKIFVQTARDKPAPKRKGICGISEIVSWAERHIPCSYSPENMTLNMDIFGYIVCTWGGVPLFVMNDITQDHTPSESDGHFAQDPEGFEPTFSSINSWGAAEESP